MLSSKRLLPVGWLTLCMVLFLTAALSGSMGCGGGGSSTSSNPSPVRVGRARVSITWPKQTRLVPSASLSVVIKIQQGDTVVRSQTIVRPADGGTVTAEFDALPVGTLTATATAYPNADGTGTVQATGVAPLEITAGQVTPFRLTMASTIKSLGTIPFSGDYTQGRTLVTVYALDATGAVVLVNPSNYVWSSSNTRVATITPTEINNSLEYSSALLTTLRLGTAVITVTESESGLSYSIEVRVVFPEHG